MLQEAELAAVADAGEIRLIVTQTTVNHGQFKQEPAMISGVILEKTYSVLEPAQKERGQLRFAQTGV